LSLLQPESRARPRTAEVNRAAIRGAAVFITRSRVRAPSHPGPAACPFFAQYVADHPEYDDIVVK
jgi:hypothetical protein